MSYIVAKREYSSDLAGVVTACLDNGWKLAGPLVSHRGELHQPMQRGLRPIGSPVAPAEDLDEDLNAIFE